MRIAAERRNAFLDRPVVAPAGIELDPVLMGAVGNLSEGKKPFGLKGLFGKSEQKKQIESIRVLGRPPADAESWKHALEYCALLKCLCELSQRWNALAIELSLNTLAGDKPEDALVALDGFRLYLKMKEMVAVQGQIARAASFVFPTWPRARESAGNGKCLSELERALQHHLTKNRLANVWVNKERIQKVLEGRTGKVVDEIRESLAVTLGNPKVSDAEMQAKWSALMAELSRVLGLSTHLSTVREISGKVTASGAPRYAELLKRPITSTVDTFLPVNWRKVWQLRRLATYLDSIDAHEELKKLTEDRHVIEGDLSRAYREVVVKRTWLKLAENASPSIRSALQAYLGAVQKIGKGTGKRAVRYRQDARTAASQANPAVPCWIMAHYRVSETLPAELGCFDLVVIDEASQSDFTALPALLRAKKVLIVGDDKQVSPEGVGLDELKVRSLMERFLSSQVATYRPLMSPERSIYDLFKVVFAKSAVMLREHFRCVGPIIEYSKREFYNHELRPLRLPKASERLDPPLIDVLVTDGYRKDDVNLPEARFIVEEIRAIVADPKMAGRSIGIVSLLGDKQALAIWEQLADELGPEIMQRHRVTCGDARTFQGKERNIMFLSLISAPNEIGAPLSRDTFAQRFNVAASRAKDRMYLVRSVEPDQLSSADKLRRSLISHFTAPFAQDEKRVEDLRKQCESDFEREVFDELTKRGYRVVPQEKVGHYRIDLVVEGYNDARLAVECDGDRYHGPDKWAEDLERQRILERAGWVFWRCFASAFIRRRKDTLDDLVKTLTKHGIDPIGADNAPRSVYTEHRVVSSSIYSVEMDSKSIFSEGIEKTDTVYPQSQSDRSSRIDEAVQVQDELRPSIENEELSAREGAVIESREKQEHYSMERSVSQLSVNFEKKPVEAHPAHLEQPEILDLGSTHEKRVREHPIRGKEVEKKNPKTPKISSSRQPVDSGSCDPFSEAVMTLLTDKLKHCPVCHERMALLFGMYGPYIKCSKCDEKGQIPHPVLFETVSKLQPPCEKCGRPMLAVQFRGKVLAGCSSPNCERTEPWKALAKRLQRLALTMKG
ncbi:MAG: AAA domain-containing protein [Syntrophobacteraceae bacterium]